MRKVGILVICFILCFVITSSAEYNYNSDDTITDTLTGLVWQNDATSNFYLTIDDANKFIESLNKGIYSTWRLPTTIEIEHIENYIETKYNSNIGMGVFWATPNAVCGVFNNSIVSGFSVLFYSSLLSGAAVWAVRNNAAPVANAGENQDVLEKSIVTLDASMSYDLDRDIVIWDWKQITGNYTLMLYDSLTPIATFTAPDINSPQETIEFKLRFGR